MAPVVLKKDSNQVDAVLWYNKVRGTFTQRTKKV